MQACLNSIRAASPRFLIGNSLGTQSFDEKQKAAEDAPQTIRISDDPSNRKCSGEGGGAEDEISISGFVPKSL